MKSYPFSKMSGLESQVGLALPWLVGLRWAAMVSQALLILVLVFIFKIPVPPLLASIIFAFSLVSNYYLQWRHQTERSVSNGLVTGILMLDTFMLTLLLFATGGALNPFTFLYLIHVVLAAIILPQAGVWIITLGTIVCYGCLFLPGIQTIGALINHPPACHAQSEVTGTMRLHLQGMWVAYSFSAICIVFIVGKIQKALSLHRQTSISLHDEKLRSEMLASLATLAAGATHELSTPLSTIAVASSEMIDSLKQHDCDSELMQDAVLIRNQVRNCKDVLFQMTADAGEHRGEAPRKFTTSEAVNEIISNVDPVAKEKIEVQNSLPDMVLRMPFLALCRSVAGLLNNAREADTNHRPIVMNWLLEGDSLLIKVEDQGCGMDEEAIRKAVEPFYTTRPNGLGLGLFLASTMADRFGGSLEFQSSPNEGTTAFLRMKMARIT